MANQGPYTGGTVDPWAGLNRSLQANNTWATHLSRKKDEQVKKDLLEAEDQRAAERHALDMAIKKQTIADAEEKAKARQTLDRFMTGYNAEAGVAHSLAGHDQGDTLRSINRQMLADYERRAGEELTRQGVKYAPGKASEVLAAQGGDYAQRFRDLYKPDERRKALSIYQSAPVMQEDEESRLRTLLRKEGIYGATADAAVENLTQDLQSRKALQEKAKASRSAMQDVYNKRAELSLDAIKQATKGRDKDSTGSDKLDALLKSPLAGEEVTPLDTSIFTGNDLKDANSAINSSTMLYLESGYSPKDIATNRAIALEQAKDTKGNFDEDRYNEVLSTLMQRKTKAGTSQDAKEDARYKKYLELITPEVATKRDLEAEAWQSLLDDAGRVFGSKKVSNTDVQAPKVQEARLPEGQQYITTQTGNRIPVQAPPEQPNKYALEVGPNIGVDLASEAKQIEAQDAANREALLSNVDNPADRQMLTDILNKSGKDATPVDMEILSYGKGDTPFYSLSDKAKQELLDNRYGYNAQTEQRKLVDFLNKYSTPGVLSTVMPPVTNPLDSITQPVSDFFNYRYGPQVDLKK